MTSLLLGLINTARACFLGYDLLQSLPGQQAIDTANDLYKELLITRSTPCHPSLPSHRAYLWINFMLLNSIEYNGMGGRVDLEYIGKHAPVLFVPSVVEVPYCTPRVFVMGDSD